MQTFAQRREGAVTIHGKGEIDRGKVGGLVLVESARPKRAAKLRSDVLATEFYERFMGNGQKLDPETLGYLRNLHGTFEGQPIGVRPSEKDEDDPAVPTSGANTTFMLPNNHPDSEIRFRQFRQAIEHAFRQFAAKQKGGEGVDVVINPVHGVLDQTSAGLIYYPMSSGVVDSFTYYPAGDEKPEHGFARLAFGHGYAAVRNDFDVVQMRAALKPEAPGAIDGQQRWFYAIDMDKNEHLNGEEMETMTPRLKLEFAKRHNGLFGNGASADFAGLVADKDLGYASGLRSIMEGIAAKAGNFFQIEFTFNVIDGEGVFHVVQCKCMPGIDQTKVVIPEDGKRPLLALESAGQGIGGNGIIPGISSAIVISPYKYRKSMHDDVRRTLQQLNEGMKERGERYILLCPGRLGTSNRDWGVYAQFSDISQVAAIVEIGVDAAGRDDVEPTEDEKMIRGYSCHYQWRMLGGAEDEERAKRMRMHGSQGTHFTTNLKATGAVHLHIRLGDGKTRLDPWLFDPPEDRPESPIYPKHLDPPVTIYAEFGKRCVIK